MENQASGELEPAPHPEGPHNEIMQIAIAVAELNRKAELREGQEDA